MREEKEMDEFSQEKNNRGMELTCKYDHAMWNEPKVHVVSTGGVNHQTEKSSIRAPPPRSRVLRGGAKRTVWPELFLGLHHCI